MKRMVFKSVAKLAADDPVEIFWLAGLELLKTTQT